MRFVYLARLSDASAILRYARRVNSLFLKQGKTDLRHLDSEYEAACYLDGTKVAAIIVYGMIDDEDRDHRCYYIPIAWVSPKYRGLGLYAKLIDWLKGYAKQKGAATIETDVRATNDRMVALSHKNWEQTYVRFRIKL